MAWYAWSDIRYDADVDASGAVLKHHMVKAGDSVTAAKLKLNDEQFQQLVDAGSVRSYKGPHEEMRKVGAPIDQSPVEYLRAKLTADEDQLAAVGGGGSYFGPSEEASLLGEGDEVEEASTEEAK